MRTAKKELFFSSPYVTQDGTNFVNAQFSSSFRESGNMRFLTNLSPLNICQKVTDPRAIKSLAAVLPGLTITYLPKLHAKVYIADWNSNGQFEMQRTNFYGYVFLVVR